MEAEHFTFAPTQMEAELFICVDQQISLVHHIISKPKIQNLAHTEIS
jgi:hypothetical protein